MINVRYFGRLKCRHDHGPAVGRRGRILMVKFMVEINKPQAWLSPQKKGREMLPFRNSFTLLLNAQNKKNRCGLCLGLWRPGCYPHCLTDLYITLTYIWINSVLWFPFFNMEVQHFSIAWTLEGYKSAY